MEQLFYWNALQGHWIRIPDEVKEFLGTIPQISVIHANKKVEILFSKVEMTEAEIQTLPKVCR
jgi:hypothetical protein